MNVPCKEERENAGLKDAVVYFLIINDNFRLGAEAADDTAVDLINRET